MQSRTPEDAVTIAINSQILPEHLYLPQHKTCRWECWNYFNRHQEQPTENSIKGLEAYQQITQFEVSPCLDNVLCLVTCSANAPPQWLSTHWDNRVQYCPVSSIALRRRTHCLESRSANTPLCDCQLTETTVLLQRPITRITFTPIDLLNPICPLNPINFWTLPFWTPFTLSHDNRKTP